MGILLQSGVQDVYHFAPLHYLPFIARSGSLMNKPGLTAAGFQPSHFRTMSKDQDVARGFGAYAHLTLDNSPRILKAKLAAGFPHVGFSVPASSVDEATYSLCRFNVAMTRFLRRNGKKGFPESPTNGRYYNGHQIPIARGAGDKKAMLDWHPKRGTMIEVLIHGNLELPQSTVVLCYSEQDATSVQRVLKQCGQAWTVRVEEPPGRYPVHNGHRDSVDAFVQSALADPEWRGNGLEFDRL